MAPLPPGLSPLRHPDRLAGLGGAARPWVRLLEETEAAPGWAAPCGSFSSCPGAEIGSRPQLGNRRWEGIGSLRISSGDLGAEIGSRRSLGNDGGWGLALSAAQLPTWGRGLALRSLGSDLRAGGGDWLPLQPR